MGELLKRIIQMPVSPGDTSTKRLRMAREDEEESDAEEDDSYMILSGPDDPRLIFREAVNAAAGKTIQFDSLGKDPLYDRLYIRRCLNGVVSLHSFSQPPNPWFA